MHPAKFAPFFTKPALLLTLTPCALVAMFRANLPLPITRLGLWHFFDSLSLILFLTHVDRR